MSVSIRAWRVEDASALAAAIGNEKVLENLRDGVPFPYTEKDGEEFIRGMLDADPEAVFPFAVVSDGIVVGGIGVFRQANIHRLTAETGFYVGEEHWGRGICTEAVRLVCRHIFGNTDIIRIYAQVFAGNGASRRVLEKAGFRQEGVLRSSAVKNGRVIDTVMYARIKDL